MLVLNLLVFLYLYEFSSVIYLPTNNSMEQSPLGTPNSHSAFQEILRFWNPDGHYPLPATDLYPEPAKSSPHIPTLFP